MTIDSTGIARCLPTGCVMGEVGAKGSNVSLFSAREWPENDVSLTEASAQHRNIKCTFESALLTPLRADFCGNTRWRQEN